LANSRVSIREMLSHAFAFWRGSHRRVFGVLAACAVATLVSTAFTAGFPQLITNMIYIGISLMAQGALFRLAIAEMSGSAPEPVGPSGFQWRGVEWRLVGLTLRLYLLIVAVVVVVVFLLAAALGPTVNEAALSGMTPEEFVATLTPEQRRVIAIGFAAVAALLTWVSARLSLALPMSAHGPRIQLFASWPLTRGTAWPIILGSALLIAPIFLLVAIAGAIWADQPATAAWAVGLVVAIGQFFYLPLSVGMLTWLYLQLRPSAKDHS
jgi:hypothetical protein